MTPLTAQVVLFYCLAAGSVVSAFLAVTRRNPVHSMLWVLALFLHMAGIFLLLGTEFLAAVQIIVYAGAILVFYLFVLMLLDLPGEEARPRFSLHWPLAVAGGVGLVALLWLTQGAARTTRVTATLGTAADDSAAKNLLELARALFGPFALAFELAGLLLLAAIVGAVIVARRRTES
jgi:NADH-quinone oxidoreductase subunit J